LIDDEEQFIVKATPLKSRFDKRRYDSQYHKITASSNNEEYALTDFTNHFLVDDSSNEEWIIPELFHL